MDAVLSAASSSFSHNDELYLHTMIQNKPFLKLLLSEFPVTAPRKVTNTSVKEMKSLSDKCLLYYLHCVITYNRQDL